MKCYMTGKPCDYHKANINNNQMFIISPFGFPFDYLYADGGRVQEALNKSFKAIRSDQTMRIGSIMCQSICKEIIESQYMFADLSLPNANVYYELGLAYALGREIIAAIDTSLVKSNRYSNMFVNSWSNNKTFLQYTDIYSLENNILHLDFHEPITKPDIEQPSYDSDKNQNILILENGDSGISRIYEAILDSCQQYFTFSNDMMKILTDSEQASFTREISQWKNWHVRTMQINNSSELKDVVIKIAESNICIVDSTAYRNRNEEGPVTNPYMCFCLGVAHGFEKEVIPITNIRHSSSAPFDVRGLWHIFFSQDEDLTKSLMKIIPRISVEIFKKRTNAPYRNIWDGFLDSKKTLSVIYCGRPALKDNQEDSYYENRGPRTNIDSWDTKAVSEVSFYLAQKYPTSLIKPISPQTKSKWDGLTQEQIAEQIKEIQPAIEQQLAGRYSNCIIVGSPDVNDYAEVILANIYGVAPFDPKVNTVTKGGFIFNKNNIKADIRSSFYRKVDKDMRNSVIFETGEYICDDKSTYGVLTIAKNPFSNQFRVIVLSGFTGIATCGLIELLIESEPEIGDDEDKSFKKLLNEQLQAEIIKKYDSSLERPITALVKFKYETKYDQKMSGDNRRLKKVQVIEVVQK